MTGGEAYLKLEYFENAAATVADTIEAIGERTAKEFREPKWIIKSRIKSGDGIEEKISRKRRARPSYSAKDLTDIAGVRVIVASLATASALADFIRSERIFTVVKADSEDFNSRPREDGYRGIHMIVRVQSHLPGRPVVPVELQIRTAIQHQWAELSHADFYKEAREIPPDLLERMRALSEVLHAADVEAENLRNSRVVDECLTALRQCLRGKVLEELAPWRVQSKERASEIGRSAIALVELFSLARRIAGTRGERRERALSSLEAAYRDLAEREPAIAASVAGAIARLKALGTGIPRDWL